jgi:hypothetical protein
VRPCEREPPAAAVEKHGDAEARRGHGWCAAGVGQPDAIEKVAESLQSPRARRHTACLAELGSVAQLLKWPVSRHGWEEIVPLSTSLDDACRRVRRAAGSAHRQCIPCSYCPAPVASAERKDSGQQQPPSPLPARGS